MGVLTFFAIKVTTSFLLLSWQVFLKKKMTGKEKYQA